MNWLLKLEEEFYCLQIKANVEESGTIRFCAILSLPVDRMFFKAYICCHAIEKSLRLVKEDCLLLTHKRSWLLFHLVRAYFWHLCVFVSPQLELRSFYVSMLPTIRLVRSLRKRTKGMKRMHEKNTLKIVLKYSRFKNALRYYHIFLPKFLGAYHREFSCDLE